MADCCPQNYQDLCIEALRDAGLRVTKQRITVIECLSKAKKPLTAPEVYETLSKRSKSTPLDKVSVYRALDSLLQLNLVHRVSPSGAYLACNHQECVDAHHVMSRCTNCNEVKELGIPSEVVAPLLFHMKNSLDFTPDPHLLQMDGLCPNCCNG